MPLTTLFQKLCVSEFTRLFYKRATICNLKTRHLVQHQTTLNKGLKTGEDPHHPRPPPT